MTSRSSVRAETASDSDADAKPAGEPAGSGTSGGSDVPPRDARLKEAVAAWVAVSEDEPSSARPKGEGEGAGKGSGSADRPEGEGSGAAERPAKVPADRATAVFGAVRPKGDGSGSGDASDGVSGSGPAKDLKTPAGRADEGSGSADASNGADEPRPAKDAKAPADRATAVFGAVRPKGDGSGSGDASAKDGVDESGSAKAAKAPAGRAGEGSGSGDASDGGNGSGSPKAPAKDADAPADRATAVFGMVKPKAAAASEAPASGDVQAKAPADQPTAVFGAVKPKGAADSKAPASGETPAKAPAKGTGVDRPTAAFGAVKPKADAGTPAKAPAKAADADTPAKTPADQPTAVFGAVKPKQGPAPDKPAVSVDQPTELLKAPDVKGAAGRKGAAESDSEKTSQFVPLKSLDEAAAKAKPAARPKPGSAPAAKPESAPKPAIPVSVTPPAAAPKAKVPAPKPPVPGPGAGASAEPAAGGPAAPLDLLAQLTNTPPPPETPVRTAVRRVKIWTPLVLLLVIVFCVVQAFRPLPAPKLSVASAKATYAFGGERFAMPWPDQGQAAAKVVGVGSLGTYGEEKPVPTASVAKVMTAYVILKNHPLKKGDKGQEVEVDAEAEQESGSTDESRVTLRKGEKFTQYDLLQMLLIPSGNNAARLLARWDAGTRDAFVAKMNAAAKDLGMTRTTYTDPSGFDKTTVSTAVDQLKLAEAVMKDEVFKEIVAKPNADVPGQHLNNNNDTLLLKVGVLGIKTGSSTPAGGTLMWAAKRTVGGKEHQILGVTMDQHFKDGPDPNAENSLTMVKNVSYKMIKSVQDTLTSVKIVKKGEVVGYVDDGLGGRTPLVATRDLTGAGWPGMTAKLTIGKGGKKTLPHAAKAGTEIGELTVGSGTGAMTVPVALKKALDEPSFGAKLTRLG
ncbi:serine hydrolase [Streptomyces sp. ISL-11]|uniref:serine hydrolase n=1 Tax=Streptomyces sp. ISL-11 TaxID=2819174 RepID=UPI0027E5113F|nr:serine hydrolase [Streptomyces sp. ISL-11]